MLGEALGSMLSLMGPLLGGGLSELQDLHTAPVPGHGGPGGGHPLILTATLDPHALQKGVRRLALRSLLGPGRTANLRGITVRRLYGAEEMVDEQAKAFEDGKRAATAASEEMAKMVRQAKAMAYFTKVGRTLALALALALAPTLSLTQP